MNLRYALPLAALLGLCGPAQAATITALDTNSLVVAAPSSTTIELLDNDPYVVAFNEVSGLILSSDLVVNGGTIAAGSRIDSHMIALARDGDDGQGYRHDFSFGFSQDILGIISGSANLRQTSGLLGAAGTTYVRLNGLETSDTVNVGTFEISGQLRIWTPYTDFVRVITVAQVPVPAAGGSLVLALGGLFVMRGLRPKT